MRLDWRSGLLAIVFGSLAASGSAQWSVTNLHPAGASESTIYGVLGGSQVGYAYINGVGCASKWSGTAASWVNLNPVNSTQSYALSISGSNQLGSIWMGGLHHATLWSGTSTLFVNLTPAGASESEGNRSFNGVQMGAATFGFTRHAGMWTGSAASWVDLHPLGSIESFAYDTDGTQQVGGVHLGGIYGASLWSGSVASYVSLHPAVATQSYALGIDNGQQVGHAVVGGQSTASLWTGTAASWVNLQPAGTKASIAFAVDNGQQVGMAILYDGRIHAGMWTGTAASWVDLHAYLPAHFTWSEAIDVWSDATTTHIGGFGFNSQTGRREAIVWTTAPVNFSFALDKSSVAGQNSVLATITMDGARPANTVFQTSDNSSLVTTASILVIPTGQVSRSIRVTVSPVTSPITTTIYAKLGPVTHSQALTLMPLIPTALAFTPSQVTGGSSTMGRLVINGVAGPGGKVISLADNSAFAETPSQVTVPAGGNQVSFPITTASVSSPTLVTVTASVGAGQKTGTFRINP